MYSNVDSLHTRNLSMSSTPDPGVGPLLPVGVSSGINRWFSDQQRGQKQRTVALVADICGHLATLADSRLVAEWYSPPANLLINFCTNAVQACTVSSVSFRDSTSDTFHTASSGWKLSFKFHISFDCGYRLAATTNQPLYFYVSPAYTTSHFY